MKIEPSEQRQSGAPAAAAAFAVRALARAYAAEADKARMLPRLQTARERITALPDKEAVQEALKQLENMEREATHLADAHLQTKKQLAARATSLASSTDWKEARTVLDRLARDWASAGWSDEQATAPCRRQFTEAVATFTKRQEQWFDEQRMRGAPARDFREYLCMRAEQLSAETDDTMWAASGERLRQLTQLWKKIGPGNDQALVERFAAARQAFEERRAAWYDANEARRAALLHRIDVLTEATEGGAWEAARREVNEICEEDWHAAGLLPQQRHDAMEQRLQQALERFRAREEKAEREALEQKRTIVNRIAALGRHPAGNWKATRATLLELQETYAALGPVPQADEQEMLQAYRAACQSVVDALQTLRGSSTEKRTEIVRRITDLTKEAESSGRWRDARDKVLLLQRQYAGAGPISRPEGESLWQAYRAACDRFFEVYRSWTGSNVPAKEELCQEAEALLQEPDAFDAKEKAKKLQQRWKASGPVPQEQNEALWSRFSAALDDVFERARREWEDLQKG